MDRRSYRLSEQHPREQGLKPGEDRGLDLFAVGFQSNIQENKDWNWLKTHSQTCITSFQSNIQENKDWNPSTRMQSFTSRALSEQHPREQGLKRSWCTRENRSRWRSFRATSKRTRIETAVATTQIDFRPMLSEQHPREQGLKLPDAERS